MSFHKVKLTLGKAIKKPRPKGQVFREVSHSPTWASRTSGSLPRATNAQAAGNATRSDSTKVLLFTLRKFAAEFNTRSLHSAVYNNLTHSRSRSIKNNSSSISYSVYKGSITVTGVGQK